jgi:hypothetical protein
VFVPEFCKLYEIGLRKLRRASYILYALTKLAFLSLITRYVTSYSYMHLPRVVTRLKVMVVVCLSCSRTPEQCPSVVSLLAESYNPHVRYGAAMALGIACAGTGLKVSSIFRICMPANSKILCHRFFLTIFVSVIPGNICDTLRT